MKTEDIYFEYENTEGVSKDAFVKEKYCVAVDAANAIIKENKTSGVWPDPKHKRQSATYRDNIYMISFVVTTGEDNG